VVVAVVFVRVVQVPVDQVVDVVAVRDRLVTAALSVGVGRIAARVGRVAVRMVGVDLEHMLVDVVVVRVVQVAVVQVVGYWKERCPAITGDTRGFSKPLANRLRRDTRRPEPVQAAGSGRSFRL
jgi:hypothetical protein